VRICLFLISVLIIHSVSNSQTVTLPVGFESGSVSNSHFTNFDGGVGTVIPNPFPMGINTSATVGRMVRSGGQVWAGAYLTTSSNMNFSVNPIVCMKVYTTAPVGTRVSLKMEGCGGVCYSEKEAFTTLSGAWETLCYNFTGQPTSFNRLVFLFGLGSIGNGSNQSTFYFDDIEQRPTFPLAFTPGSQYFCPNGILTLTYPGPGIYNWYADAAGTTLLQASSSTFTTPVLTGETSYYVKNMVSSPFPSTALGPSIPGGTAIGNSITTSTFFKSNLNNGFFYSVDILLHIPTGPIPLNTCTYKVDVINITQGTNRTLTQGFVSPVNFQQRPFVFSSPLPIFLNDILELRITSLTTHPCYCVSSSSGDNGLFLPFPNSYYPQITFTGHTSNGLANSYMSGLNYTMSGDFVDPTLYQVNALVDCINPLPVELLSFSVQEEDGDALLTWTTASELNNDRFLITRSTDGLEYHIVGSQVGAGNSSALIRYYFKDPDPLEGLSYYQLKQVDYDGTESLSWPVPYVNGISNEFKLFPNPTTQNINILLDGLYDVVETRIFDLNGRMVDKITFQSAQILNFDIKSKPGIYLVEIVSKEESKAMFKVVKK
jgi:hypothetical protein